MRNLLALILAVFLVACSSVSEKSEKNENALQEKKVKKIQKEYQLEIAWEESKVYDVKLNNKEVENGEAFKLKSSEKHKISWVAPSMSVELAITYETEGKRISSPNKETEITGKIGINIKEIELEEDSYIYIEGTTLKILPLTNISLPEEEAKKEFDILNVSDDKEVEVFDKTK